MPSREKRSLFPCLATCPSYASTSLVTSTTKTHRPSIRTERRMFLLAGHFFFRYSQNCKTFGLFFPDPKKMKMDEKTKKDKKQAKKDDY